MLKVRFVLMCFMMAVHCCWSQPVMTGAAQIDQYVPLLKGKKVGVFANQTSVLDDQHLVDVLKENNVDVRVIFGPEHGFRGTADAGAKVGNYIDPKTGIPVISLYGSKRRPTESDLKNIDILLYDIQDVGVRFYTYISSLEEFMEAAFIHAKPLIILDRPNPNIHYVDGPVLDTAFRSFVGMQPVPVVYGMTIAEYAKMLVGERWLSDKAMRSFDLQKKSGADLLKVIPCTSYTRQSIYQLPVKPSPNLPSMAAVYWYPSTCFFEGTVLSEGRGTSKPFQWIGHPSLPDSMFSFTPISVPGAGNPKLKDKLCYGWDLSGDDKEVMVKLNGRLQLSFLLEAYRLFPDKDHFFILPTSGNTRDAFFNKLAGSDLLMSQIKAGMREEEIRASWKPGLKTFNKIRSKYLIYK
ncbi:MAG: exo-beta-N-acetylmuramidase NamZ domain-containing protein [bacterium]|jgi:uncharacterized protein YbbC (DUF1343 family)